ncbi:hypothetical protein IW15_13425 [Chryseobacterium soli]|uniref:Uncharacterized protein n=1 Tax=Chryseobacterium soli TaxID=445961 RepID=A0A086A763_9FLAO|nr:hypothetical protein IW15_13425 [Chryseobacterium soli]
MSYSYITKDYNSTKSIYQPYKTFVQLSSFHYNNVIITILKGLAGVIGFGVFSSKGKKINYFTSLFLLMNLFELIILASLQFLVFKVSSSYIDNTGIIASAILCVILSFFYFKNAEIKKITGPILLSLFLTVISYYLH